MFPKKNVEKLSFFLFLVDCGDVHHHHSKAKVVKANYQISILNADGQPAVQGPKPGPNALILDFDLVMTEDDCIGWGHDKLIKSTQLTNPELELVVNNELTILCKIWICGRLKKTIRNGGNNCNPPVKKRIMMAKDKVLMNIGKMFKESIGSDIEIRTNQRVLKAHKVILMAQSSVFSAMFSANMIEKESSTVEIIDFDDEIVEGMLEYNYTGATGCMQERAPELLRIAEKYDISGLKNDCEYQLVDNLNKKNAAAILIVAHTQNASYLKQRTLEFINLNKEELLKSQSFQDVLKAQADTCLLTDLYFSQQ
ncbi:unnamed protein product [Orchesella dallaii]|uniref:Protein roadkill n=1 Tax=Orchesella dallaii TaxID=48710 RepID=A0ABP1Q1X4_9HEXA